MKVYNRYITGLKDLTLALGFFDGMHIGHRRLICDAVDFARKNNSKTAILTFNESPAIYFGNNDKNFPGYIYTREDNFKLAESLGADYIFSLDFAELADMTGEEYLNNIVNIFTPKAIFSGYNHTFGYKKGGNASTLNNFSKISGYKYFCVDAIKINEENVSSTKIKDLLKSGDINSANNMLGNKFFIKSKVIHGLELGRKLGFPTANMLYPNNIIKLPYGVYKVDVFEKPAVLNWGLKPTVGGKNELLEVYIPNYNADLYGKELHINFVKKIRDEIKFKNLEELRSQIIKDTEECLK